MNVRVVDSPPIESLRILLNEIIDYAGLFPPSQVSMPDAVLNYATYRGSNYGWMLGRFVLPVSRLEEFYESANEFLPMKAENPWRLSVLAGEDLNATVRTIRLSRATAGVAWIISPTVFLPTSLNSGPAWMT